MKSTLSVCSSRRKLQTEALNVQFSTSNSFFFLFNYDEVFIQGGSTAVWKWVGILVIIIMWCSIILSSFAVACWWCSPGVPPSSVSFHRLGSALLWLRLSLTRRPLCGRPEVLAVPAGLPVRVHRGRGDRRRGEHRWVWPPSSCAQLGVFFRLRLRLWLAFLVIAHTLQCILGNTILLDWLQSHMYIDVCVYIYDITCTWTRTSGSIIFFPHHAMIPVAASVSALPLLINFRGAWTWLAALLDQFL